MTGRPRPTGSPRARARPPVSTRSTGVPVELVDDGLRAASASVYTSPLNVDVSARIANNDEPSTASAATTDGQHHDRPRSAHFSRLRPCARLTAMRRSPQARLDASVSTRSFGATRARPTSSSMNSVAADRAAHRRARRRGRRRRGVRRRRSDRRRVRRRRRQLVEHRGVRRDRRLRGRRRRRRVATAGVPADRRLRVALAAATAVDAVAGTGRRERTPAGPRRSDAKPRAVGVARGSRSPRSEHQSVAPDRRRRSRRGGPRCAARSRSPSATGAHASITARTSSAEPPVVGLDEVGVLVRHRRRRRSRKPRSPSPSIRLPALDLAGHRVDEHRAAVLPARLVLAPPAHDLGDARLGRAPVARRSRSRRSTHDASSAPRPSPGSAARAPPRRRPSVAAASGRRRSNTSTSTEAGGHVGSVTAGVHPHRAADRAGHADRPLEPGEAGRRRAPGQHRAAATAAAGRDDRGAPSASISERDVAGERGDRHRDAAKPASATSRLEPRPTTSTGRPVDAPHRGDGRQVVERRRRATNSAAGPPTR